MQSAELVAFVRDLYGTGDFVPLHAPVFDGNEQAYVGETIRSTFVSSVGPFVDRIEADVRAMTGSVAAVATVNGTAALQIALREAGVRPGDLVITQTLTFVATCNVLLQLGAAPVFVDVERVSLGLDPDAVDGWLTEHAALDDDGTCRERATGARVAAVMPMHTFGHPVRLDELVEVSGRWRVPVVEDAAESVGSWYKDRHTGTIGELGALSFNGNKIVTTGGGGIVLARDEQTGRHLKHVTTTAKVPHPYEFVHDEPGFNLRMPNLNAALGVAQLETLPDKLASKRKIADAYAAFLDGSGLEFVVEPEYARSNYWLNAAICPDEKSRTALLVETNAAGVMTRPVWRLMHHLPMFEGARRGELAVSEDLEARLVNLPSSPLPESSLSR